MLIESSIKKSAFIVVGTSNQAIKITQILQLLQCCPVLNKEDDCWIEQLQKLVSIELLLIPYGCDCRSCPLRKVIVANKIKRIATYDIPNDETAFQLLQEGNCGAFYINDPIEVISKGVRLMLNDELWFKRTITSRYILLKGYPQRNSNHLKEFRKLSYLLSRREIEVLFLIRSDVKYLDISDELFISINTVKSHVRHIFKKLGVESRAELKVFMDEHRFL